MRACFLVLLLAFVPLQTPSGAGHPFTVGQDPQSEEEEIPDVQCGAILVRGCDQLTRTELCRRLEEATQNPSDPAVRDSSAAKVIDEYHRRGFLGVDLAWSDAEKRTDVSTLAAVLTIAEGPVYRLHRLEMVGNETTRDKVIRRRVALNEGWHFDEELLALSIERINQLGIFQEFTRADVGVKANKKQHYVDLVFHLVEKQ